MKLNFNLREPKSQKETPVKLIIRWNNQRLVYATKISILPALWNFNVQRVRSVKNFQHPSFKSVKAINLYLERVEHSARAVWDEMNLNNTTQIIEAPQFKELLDTNLNRTVSGAKSFMPFFREFVELGEDRISKRSGKYISPNSSKQIKTLYNIMLEYNKYNNLHFLDFEEERYHSSFQKITEYFIKAKSYANNTIATHIKNLKVVLNAAHEKRLLTSNDFKNYKYNFEDTDSIALTSEQLNNIYSLDLSNNSTLEKQRDLFIVGAWTALRYSDLKRIRREHIEGNFIKVTTGKSDEKVVIPIVKQVKEVLVKYHYSLPKTQSIHLFNKAIKRFCRLIPELNKPVEVKRTIAGKVMIITKEKWQLCSSHTCRRSACTNFYKMGIPVSMIMKISGHTSGKNFFKYIKIDKEEAAQFVLDHINASNNRKAENFTSTPYYL